MSLEAQGDNKPDLLVALIKAFGIHMDRRQKKRKTMETCYAELSFGAFKSQDHLIYRTLDLRRDLYLDALPAAPIMPKLSLSVI